MIAISRDWLTESQIDSTLEDSFPSSDPPSWTLGIENKTTDTTAAKADEARNRAALILDYLRRVLTPTSRGHFTCDKFQFSSVCFSPVRIGDK